MVRDLIKETHICEDGALPDYINKDTNFDFRSVYLQFLSTFCHRWSSPGVYLLYLIANKLGLA
jgi:hypothetical protein